jgi:NADPH:quinone reductase-like Zn-dependent oxidoreductase
LTGEYGVLPPLPAIGGSEGVGRIAAMEARLLVPLPDGADPLQLAMLTVNPPTASLMLSEFVPMIGGDWVTQNVANSGVGSYLCGWPSGAA